jgi:hypothetical protein
MEVWIGVFGNWYIWMAAVAYGCACVYCWIQETKRDNLRRIEREARQEQQDREWAEQSPSIRILCALLRARRQEHNEVLEQLRIAAALGPKEKVNWRKEGF